MTQGDVYSQPAPATQSNHLCVQRGLGRSGRCTSPLTSAGALQPFKLKSLGKQAGLGRWVATGCGNTSGDAELCQGYGRTVPRVFRAAQPHCSQCPCLSFPNSGEGKWSTGARKDGHPHPGRSRWWAQGLLSPRGVCVPITAPHFHQQAGGTPSAVPSAQPAPTAAPRASRPPSPRHDHRGPIPGEKHIPGGATTALSDPRPPGGSSGLAQPVRSSPFLGSCARTKPLCRG